MRTSAGKVILVVGVVFLLFLGFMGLAMANGWAYATGNGADTVAVVKEEGFICKTWAVQFTNDHPVKDADGNVNEQKYSVVEKEHLDTFQKARKEGKRVSFTYKTLIAYWPCTYSDRDVITGVEIIGS